MGASQAAKLGMLGEAQALAAAHAATSGMSPGLVAAVAFGAAGLFERAAAGWKTASAQGWDKPPQRGGAARAEKYLLWRAGAARALAWAHQGVSYLENGGEEAGLARRCTLSALQELEARVAPGFGQEKAACDRFQKELGALLRRIDRSVESQNAIVFFKNVPAERPAPLPAKYIASPLKFTVPEGAGVGQEAVPPPPRAGAGPPESSNGGRTLGRRALRLFAVCVAMPALALISLGGFAASLVLWPAALLCPCVGCLPLLTAKCIEVVAKLPFRACLWASALPEPPAERAPSPEPPV